MRWKVGRRTLLLFAGLIWICAGGNIFRIGIQSWSLSQSGWLLNLCFASVIFCPFYFGIFKRMFKRHSQRIDNKSEKNCPFAFFDAKGWIIMIFMITLGIVVRKLQILPIRAIAIFYTGLSSALILTGCQFIYRWGQYKISKDSPINKNTL